MLSTSRSRRSPADTCESGRRVRVRLSILTNILGFTVDVFMDRTFSGLSQSRRARDVDPNHDCDEKDHGCKFLDNLAV